MRTRADRYLTGGGDSSCPSRLALCLQHVYRIVVEFFVEGEGKVNDLKHRCVSPNSRHHAVGGVDTLCGRTILAERQAL